MCFFSIMGNVSWMVLVLDIRLYHTDLVICLKVFLIPSFSLCFNICINITFNLALVDCDQVQLAPCLIRYNKYFSLFSCCIHCVDCQVTPLHVNTSKFRFSKYFSFSCVMTAFNGPTIYQNGRTTSRYGRQLIMKRYRQTAAENRQTVIMQLGVWRKSRNAEC